MKPEQSAGAAIDRVNAVVENQGFFIQEGLVSSREGLCSELLEFVDDHAAIFSPDARLFRSVPLFYHRYSVDGVDRNIYATIRLMNEPGNPQPDVLVKFLAEVTDAEALTVLADAAVEVNLANGKKVKVLDFATEELPAISDPRFGVSDLETLQQQQAQIKAVAETLKYLKSPERQAEAEKWM